MRKFLTAALCALAAVLATGPVRAEALRVGGKNFTEQLLLSAMTAQYLRAKGYAVELKNGLGSSLMRSAQIHGELDIVWEYTGTSLLLYNHVKEKLSAPETYTRVRELDAKQGLAWLDQSAIDNTYAIALPRQADPTGQLRTISALAAKIRSEGPRKRHRLAMDAEFAGRQDGLRPMLDLYDMPLRRADIKQMDPGLVYTALRNGQVMAGVVYTTDARVKGFGLKVLQDDLAYFPSYRATPVVRQQVLDAHPELASLLNALAANLDSEAMAAMNAEVDLEQKPIADVANHFLHTHGLLE